MVGGGGQLIHGISGYNEGMYPAAREIEFFSFLTLLTRMASGYMLM